MKAEEFIKKKDEDEGEFWTTSNEELAKAFEEYASIKLSEKREEIIKELEELESRLNRDEQFVEANGVEFSISIVKEVLK
jgi:hypothetical protein